MLDEAQFTIMGFIKGPVCRSQVALNVIQDHFRVFFVDPNDPTIDETDDFLATQSEKLVMPQAVFVRIKAAAGNQYVTIVHNNAHLNITSMFREKKERLPDEDTLDVIPGFIGSYPNAFWKTANTQ